jgi:hypothetical protein
LDGTLYVRVFLRGLRKRRGEERRGEERRGEERGDLREERGREVWI